MSEYRYSKTAWDIASRYSSVLASETRDLAAAIDAALAEAQKATEPNATPPAGGEPVAWQKAVAGSTVSCSGLEITIQCDSRDDKDTLMDFLVDAAYATPQAQEPAWFLDDRDRIVIGLEAVIGQIRLWLNWHRKQREQNDPPLTTDDGTHIMALPVPSWPTHGAFENWIKLFTECRAALDATPTVQAPEEVRVPDEPTKEMAIAGRKALAVVADRMAEAKLLATSSIDFWQRVGHEPANEIYKAMIEARPRALAASPRSPGESSTKWQPIETAPKDVPVIAWDDPVMGEAYYDGEDDTWWWTNTGRGEYTAHAIYPTLWHPMPGRPPLPAAPSQEVQG